MKVAVVVGVAVPQDAISSSAVEHLGVLRSLPEVDEVHLFTQQLEREPGGPAHVIRDPWRLVRHDAFRGCDIAIFHWGIHYDLFDAISLLAPAGTPVPVVHFHNCTPPSLVEEHLREGLVSARSSSSTTSWRMAPRCGRTASSTVGRCSTGGRRRIRSTS